MATVSELVEDVANIFFERPEAVNAYARALIDSGDLPKSRGRAIAHVDIEHIVKLVMAVSLSPKIKDTAETVALYYNLNALADSEVRTAGEALCDFARVIQSPENELHEDYVQGTVTFILNWPEIEVDCGGSSRLFKQGSVDFWEAYHKRSLVLSGKAFLMLGFGKGRGYVNWPNASTPPELDGG